MDFSNLCIIWILKLCVKALQKKVDRTTDAYKKMQG